MDAEHRNGFKPGLGGFEDIKSNLKLRLQRGQAIYHMYNWRLVCRSFA